MYSEALGGQTQTDTKLSSLSTERKDLCYLNAPFTRKTDVNCKDCLKATCVLCVSIEHKKHDLTDIQQIIENSKQRMTIDLAELENVIVPKFKNLQADVPIAVLDTRPGR